MNRNKRIDSVMAVVLLTLVFSAKAANVFWDGTPGTPNGASEGGSGTWSTSAANWDTGSGYAAWINGNDDRAFFDTTNSTVTLGENISLKGLVFGTPGGANDNGNWQYTIQGYNLNFSAGGTITNLNGTAGLSQTIRSGITGAPDVSVITASTGDEYTFAGLTFKPDNTATQVLGNVILQVAGLSGGGDKGCMVLGGTSTGNTIRSISLGTLGGYGRSYLLIGDACDWTLLGTSTVHKIHMVNGNFKINGQLDMSWNVGRGFYLSGGTLHLNNAGALRNYSGSPLFMSMAASIDNSSGTAITNSTHNPFISWNDGFTFIGSQGASSDLNIGAGSVGLNQSARVTVSNALTTFTSGGVISGGGGIIKYGAGTLRLTGINTYSGETLVYAGTLSLGGSRAIADTASLAIINGGKVNLEAGVNESVTNLYLNATLMAAGTWGSTASSADNQDDTYFSGPGVLTVLTGTGNYDLLLRDNFEAGLGNWTANGAYIYTGSAYSATLSNAVAIPDTKTMTLTVPLPLAKKYYTSLQISFNIKWNATDDSRWKVYTKYSADGVTFSTVGVADAWSKRVTYTLSSSSYTFSDTAKVQILADPDVGWPVAYIDDVVIIGSPAYKPRGTVISFF